MISNARSEAGCGWTAARIEGTSKMMSGRTKVRRGERPRGGGGEDGEGDGDGDEDGGEGGGGCFRDGLETDLAGGGGGGLAEEAADAD